MKSRLAMLMAVVTLSALVTSSAQQSRGGASVNWPLHNLDLAGSRFSTLDQINTANVRTLTPRWLFQHGVIEGVSNQTTPVIIDDVMYVTDSRGSTSLHSSRQQANSSGSTSTRDTGRPDPS